MKTQIKTLNENKAIILTVSGKTKTIKIEKATDVEKIINFLDDDKDILEVFTFYSEIFKNNNFLAKRFKVYFPSELDLKIKAQQKKERNSYTQTKKFKAELKAMALTTVACSKKL